jgi:hypothetical protein
MAVVESLKFDYLRLALKLPIRLWCSAGIERNQAILDQGCCLGHHILRWNSDQTYPRPNSVSLGPAVASAFWSADAHAKSFIDQKVFFAGAITLR